jgi:hypothetical protein
MLLFLAEHYLVLVPVLVLWGFFYVKQQDIPLLLTSGLLLFLTKDFIILLPRLVLETASSVGANLDPFTVLVIVSIVAGILGVIRSVRGLSVTILSSESVLDSWNYIIKGGAGRGDSAIGTIERAVIDTHMPNVTTRREPIAMELFGEKRPFLVIQNTKYKEFKMYIYARDFGVDLDVSWYFVAQPKFLKKTLSKHATGNPQDLTMRVSIFAQQDTYAFKGITHDRVKQTLDDLCEELNLDPTGLNTGSRGFLNVW